MDDEFDFLWEIINTHQKFEIVAYLAVTREDKSSKWYLTPRTRDDQRDAEGYSFEGINFFEAKFFEKNNHKLNLTRIGTNILIAICSNVNKIYIFSNGDLAPNIAKFLDKHQYIKKDGTIRTKIIFYDRKQTSITFLKHAIEDMQTANEEMEFIHYKSKSEQQLEEYKKANRDIVKDVLSILHEKKQKSRDNFFLNPTIKNFKNIFEQDKLKIAQENYFTISVCFDDNFLNSDIIKVTVGIPFTIYITLSNYFSDSINCKITIQNRNPKNKLQPLYDRPEKKDEKDILIKEIAIESLKSEIIPINYMFLDSNYEGLDISVEVYSASYFLFIKKKEIRNEISVSNKLFFTHFFGEKNQIKKKYLQYVINESYFRKEYAVHLIKGTAGVGKSRFIEETLNDIYNLTPKRDILKCIIGQDTFTSIFKKVLYLTIGIDYNSFLEIHEQTEDEYILETIPINYLFNNKKECHAFYKKIKSLFFEPTKKLKEEDIKNYAELTSKLLLKFHRGLTILVFEDLHRGGLHDFQFILELNDYLQKYNKNQSVVMILASRIYNQEHNQHIKNLRKIVEHETTGIYYDYFEINLKNRYEKNIVTILNDLEPKDSEAMIRDLIYCSSIDEPHIQKIIALCGNNPFCIIHTLVQLHQIGIINPDGNQRYQLEKINKIETDYKPHNQVSDIFRKRFTYYEQTPSGKTIFEIIHILVIYKSKIEYSTLEKNIISKKFFKFAFNTLEQERIIVHEHGIVRFEHENLFIYASNMLMNDCGKIADKIYKFLDSESSDKKSNLEYIVRSLYWGTSAFKNDFFRYSKLYFNFLYEQDLWKETIFCGELILSKNEIPLEELDIYEIEMKIRMLQSECDNIITALNQMKNLFIRIKKRLETIERDKFGKYYNIYLEIWLQKADLELHATQTNEAEKQLNSLLFEIKQNKNIHKERKAELFAWIYNRLAIVDMKNRRNEESIFKLKKGLEHAKIAEHDYYIHHCYYDLSIVYASIGKKREMNIFCKKSKMDILKENKYRNASVRTAIHEGMVLFLNGKEKDAITILEVTIETASFYSYFHEANRGLLYLSSIYLFTNQTNKADTIFIKGLKFAEIDRATKLLLGIYSGCIYHEHQKYIQGEKKALEKAEQYYKKALMLIFDKDGTKIIINDWTELIINNLKIFDAFLQKTFLEKLKPRGNCIDFYVNILRNYKTKINPNPMMHSLRIKSLSKKNLDPYYIVFP